MVILVDDPGLSPLLQLPVSHTEVLERPPIGELQYPGGVQEPRLPGQHVKKATHAPIGRGALVRIQAEPTPTGRAACILHGRGAEYEPTIFAVEAPQAPVDFPGQAGLPDG